MCVRTRVCVFVCACMRCGLSVCVCMCRGAEGYGLKHTKKTEILCFYMDACVCVEAPGTCVYVCVVHRVFLLLLLYFSDGRCLCLCLSLCPCLYLCPCPFPSRLCIRIGIRVRVCVRVRAYVRVYVRVYVCGAQVRCKYCTLEGDTFESLATRFHTSWLQLWGAPPPSLLKAAPYIHKRAPQTRQRAS